MRWVSRHAARAGVVVLSVAIALSQSSKLGPDHPAIEYMTRKLRDPVAELSRQVQAGKVKLPFDADQQGYLRGVLEALDVPVESQMAVFSKTSVQVLKIDPAHPRALFFNDSVVVGFVQHGSLELASLDPEQGMIFYTVDQRSWVRDRRLANAVAGATPLFQRRTDCLSCHISKVTHGVPGTLVRSVFPWLDGMPMRQYGVTDTDLRTPFEKLWGGWYVTGDSGSARHMGNGIVTDAAHPESLAACQTVNLASLEKRFDTRLYPTPYSDIVALMVFEHQMHMTNLLIETAWKARLALYEKANVGEAIRETVRELVDYMVFVDEPRLASPVRGNSGFDVNFAARGPRDRQGRSLRELDLQQRLMRYPCSYMIYSAVFNALPAEAKDAVYRRLWQILSGGEPEGKYARLSAADRAAVLEILRDTKTDLPAYFGIQAAGQRRASGT